MVEVARLRSGALLGFLTAVLLLSAQDTAPILVLGDGHPAFDAYPHPLTGFGLTGEQFLKNRHLCRLQGTERTGLAMAHRVLMSVGYVIRPGLVRFTAAVKSQT